MRLQIFRAVTCLPFRILPATAHSGERPLGSSSIPLNTIPSKSWIQTEAISNCTTTRNCLLTGESQPSDCSQQCPGLNGGEVLFEGDLLRFLAHGELLSGHFPQALGVLVEGFPQLPDHSFQFGWILSSHGLRDQGIDPILKARWRQGRDPKRDASEVVYCGSIQEIL